MNAPLIHRSSDKACAGWLRVFAFFHLNIAFSSIEEARRDEVIAKCYWPVLALSDKHPHIGLEASGYTLEEIAARDPAWIDAARQRIAEGRIELIGSGYSQMIGPLVPARVVAENLAHGHEVYERLLGVRPSVALVNEQAYSAGLVGHYLDAGYQAILMEWDNPSAHHPEWDPERRFLPQYAEGADGRTIALLWTDTAAFQQLQRYAHGDISLTAYTRYVRARRSLATRALCLYASDAEIFDFRPGRFRSEAALGTESEWQRIERALTAITVQPGINLIGPSHALKLIDREGAGHRMRLESATAPVPVKKQRKYNLSRWAVTGRDNTAINAACERIYRGLMEAEAGPDAWKELCYLWASDFRTHLTETRWQAYCTRLRAAEARWSPSEASSYPLPPAEAEPCTGRNINIATDQIVCRLDRRRGLAIAHARFTDRPRALLGSIPHGTFSDISLQADWYTGDCVFEAPGEPKITDLEWCEAWRWCDTDGNILVQAKIDTPKGAIEKTIRFCAGRARIEFDLRFHWADWNKGVLRLGHITVLPDAFDWSNLTLKTHNGGQNVERFDLSGQTIEHGAPVSFLVSASQGLGMTEGWAELDDGRTRLKVDVDRTTAPLLGLLTHRRSTDSHFCQLILSALELDETRKPSAYRDGPRRFRFAIESM
ncbi:MAG: glycoside hydrolase family 57 [Alphaproteobacteria bacterium]|nr:glycoside hydrolase family 57 [Alphaproteobacteria bacterium]